MAGPKDNTRVNGKAAEVIHNQKLAEIETIESEFGIKVDISEVDLGMLADLTSNDIPFSERLAIIQRMLIEGDARKIKLVKLERFMELVTLKIEVSANPTPAR